ncbi:MAG: CxxxxCH/CxxCH domain-containing protein [Acidobacteriia bacterium]|nr:CxxxxCH/CxxCH domain-containing protein [Terriglobia bacterium]
MTCHFRGSSGKPFPNCMPAVAWNSLRSTGRASTCHFLARPFN